MNTPTAPAPVTPPAGKYKPYHGGYPTPKNWPFPGKPSYPQVVAGQH